DVVDQDDIFSDSNLQGRYLNSIIDESVQKTKEYQQQLLNEAMPKRPSTGARTLDAPHANPKSKHSKASNFNPKIGNFRAANTLHQQSAHHDKKSSDKDKMTTQNVNA